MTKMHLGAGALVVAAVLAAVPAVAQDDTIIMLGGPSSDPFWGAVQQGFMRHAAMTGIRMNQYVVDNTWNVQEWGWS